MCVCVCMETEGYGIYKEKDGSRRRRHAERKSGHHRSMSLDCGTGRPPFLFRLSIFILFFLFFYYLFPFIIFSVAMLSSYNRHTLLIQTDFLFDRCQLEQDREPARPFGCCSDGMPDLIYLFFHTIQLTHTFYSTSFRQQLLVSPGGRSADPSNGHPIQFGRETIPSFDVFSFFLERVFLSSGDEAKGGKKWK